MSEIKEKSAYAPLLKLFSAKQEPAVSVPDDLPQRLIGRAAFLRDRGEVKTPELLLAAANAMLSAPPAPTTARSPQDYAIEHAEYMAVNGERLIEYLNEISDVDEGVLVPDDRFGDCVQGLRCGIHDFRKRRDRCPSHESEKSTEPTVGDYVLATKYEDGDPCDHFYVGFVSGFTGDGRFLVVDNEGNEQRRNGFRRAEVITAEEGRKLCDLMPEIGDKPGNSVWWHLSRIRGVEQPAPDSEGESDGH